MSAKVPTPEIKPDWMVEGEDLVPVTDGDM